MAESDWEDDGGEWVDEAPAKPRPPQPKKSVRGRQFSENVYAPERDDKFASQFAQTGMDELPDAISGPMAGLGAFTQSRLFGLPSKAFAAKDALNALVTPGKDTAETFRQRADYYDALLAEEAQKHPEWTTAGNVLGFMGGANALGNATGLGKAGYLANGKRATGALSMGKRLLAALGLGGLQEGATAAVDNTTRAARGDVAGAGEDVAKRALTGAGTNLAGQAILGETLLPLAGAVGRGGKRLVEGVVKPSAGAQLLQKLGVKNLTIGQMAPDSALAQIEEVGASTDILGPSIKKLRGAGAKEWQQAVLNRTRPPGLETISGGSINRQVDELARAFDSDEAYGVLKGLRVNPEVYEGAGKWRGLVTDESVKGAAKTKGAFELAVSNPNIRATDATRRETLKYLKDQLTILPKGAAKNGMPAEALQQLRSNIRTEIRRTLAGNPTREESAAADMLQAAEDSVTELLEAQLPKDVVPTLRETDQKYGMLKTLAKAVKRSGDSDAGFTPHQLSEAVKSGADTMGYARGGGGPLRELAAAGREVIEPNIPQTGVRALVSWGPTPEWAVGPAAYTMNLPGVKRALLGQTKTQLRLQDLLRKAPKASVSGRSLARLPAAVDFADARPSPEDFAPALVESEDSTPPAPTAGDELKRKLEEKRRKGRRKP